MFTIKKTLRYFVLFVAMILAIGFVIPERVTMPVVGATAGDWNPQSFWFEPWGTSGVHKGVDIFAAQGTPVVATVPLLVFFRGEFAKGGKVVIGLGPKWRIHYFAHLSTISESEMWLSAGSFLGRVGDSGNAKGKPPHLHYTIVSLIPLPWLIDNSSQGIKKAFYLDPIIYLNRSMQ